MKKIFLFACFLVLFINGSFAAEEDVSKSGTVTTEIISASEATITNTSTGTSEVTNTAEVTEVKTKISRLSSGMGGTISLDLHNIEIVQALKYLAVKTGINIVTTKKVTGRITLTVEDVRVKDIFDIMLRSNELAYVQQGNIYNIMTEDEYKLLFGKKFADVREVKTFRLKYAIPEQAFAILDTLKSDVGTVVVDPDSGTALIMDTPQTIKEAEGALAVLEQKNMIQVFSLDYANAKDIEEQLKPQLDAKKVGTIRAYERLNQVMVQALPDRMEGIEALIKTFDEKTLEVLIDARIIKVKLDDELSAGVEWEGLFDFNTREYGMMYLGSTPFTAVQSASDDWRTREQVAWDLFTSTGGITSVGSYPFSGFTTDYTSGSKVTPGEAMHVGVVSGRRDFDTLFQYLQTIGETRILSNPKIAVVNNQEARIHVGERQAYVTSTTTTGQTTTTVSEEVTFVDVGIQLAVTPHINDKGYISMKIKPEISSVTSTIETPSGNEIPIIDTSTSETTVLVKDGTTIVIGGMRREEETETTEKVPILSDLPLVGFLFKSSTTTTDRTELLIVITPHIVSGDVLTTGRERNIADDVIKRYEDYDRFSEETDFTFPKEKPEKRMKAYPDVADKKEPEVEMKPYSGYTDF